MQSVQTAPLAGSVVVILACLAAAPSALVASPNPSPAQAAQQAQPAAPAQGQAAQPAAAQVRVFTSDAGILFNTVKPDKTGDFEMVMTKLKEALQKSDKPERKQQAASWKIFKALEPGPNGNVLYVFLMDPAVKGGADYTVSKILSEAFPNDVQELFKVYAGALAAGQNIMNLQLISDLGK